ncbi:hypothetical protein [Pelagicoccus mobilis]|uniref:Uncharacterized protein n=1 Tax=Pelagicoccus mobilis TaxID=415221 RepID=A0A934S1B2_9BACT|nr:hypothetical protein [Pelagicoccus mobilis]MBK1878052.1 hypothetical protein [Pelagicoccus mobilis]
MSVLSKIKPKAQAYELDAFMAPGHWFFCRRIEIPSDLERGEEEGFVFLELENLSPFPLDHLHYGYQLDESGRYAFLFAAYRRRFEKVDQSGWRRIDAVLPDFIIGLHRSVKDGDAGLVLVTERSLVALEFDKDSELPSRFYAEARVLENEEGEAPSLNRQVDAFAANAKERFGFSKTRIWYANTDAKWVGQSAWFGAVDSSESPAARTEFSRNEIWKADLRDPEMVAQAKRDERQNGFLWKAIGGLAAGVALLLLGELYWGGSRAYLSLRETGVADNEPEVFEISELRNTTVALRDFQESNLVPFKMIEALYPLQQYPNIVYRKFETDGPDVLIIDAKAASQTQVTEFKKRLERFEKVESVELSKQVNNPSGSTFTTTIRFRFGAFFELAEVSDNG